MPPISGPKLVDRPVSNPQARTRNVPARILTLPDSPLSPKSETYSQHTVVVYSLARSDLQKATPQRDRDCMRSIVGLKFLHQVLNVEVNGGLGDR